MCLYMNPNTNCLELNTKCHHFNVSSLASASEALHERMKNGVYRRGQLSPIQRHYFEK